MNRKLSCPLWTHLPAVGMLVILIWTLAGASPLPEKVPMHFDFHGKPDQWGPPILMWIAYVLPPVLLIVFSIVIDEIWARQERPQRFNWVALLDEAVVGFLAGVAIGHAEMIRSGDEILQVPWGVVVALAAGAALVAAGLEWQRPWRPRWAPPATHDPAALRAAVVEGLRAPGPWVFWQTQNPAYVSVLVPLVCVALAIGAVISFPTLPWLLPVFLVAAVAVLAMYGGLRVIVTRAQVVVRLGVFNIRLLRVALLDVSSVEVLHFAPLPDFGGWGIRRGRGMSAFFLRGRRGVKIETAAGKKYLIGSDQPDELATVIDAVRGA